MTDEQIDRLIRRRNKLTNRRDERLNRPALNEIDAQLRQVPPGARNDVDLLLGRECAQHAKRVVMVQHASGAQEVEATWADQTSDYDAFHGLGEVATEIEESHRDWEDLRGDLAL